ncbi:MAG: hypothetical protein WA989_08795 [Henriciella sp.]|uniref:hypothetical protein n=1 Tax=Henriciella sp. TaxID=1968823 RepID=UPI003C725106
MNHCLAHVGMNKAGSTTIQEWLRANRDELRQQYIVYDPLEDGPPDTLTHDFGFAAIGLTNRRLSAPARARFKIETPEDHREKREEFMRRADASIEAAGERLYVISSERLQGWLINDEELTRFADWLSARFGKVEYVIYARDQLDWYASAYAQAIKTGLALTLETFMSRHPLIDYAAMAERWAGVAEPGCVTVRLLERDSLSGGSLIPDFADLIGANPGGMADLPRQNLSMTAEAIGEMAELNARVEADPALANDPAIKAERQELIKTVDGPPFKLPQAVALDIARRHAASNEKLRQTYFPDREALFAKSHTVLQESEGAA